MAIQIGTADLEHRFFSGLKIYEPCDPKIQFLVIYPSDRSQRDTYKHVDCSSICNSENKLCSHLEGWESYRVGITTSSQDAVIETRFSSFLEIYETSVFKAVAVRHQCIAILERWTIKKMSRIFQVTTCVLTRVFRSKWRKRNAVRSQQTSRVEQTKVKLRVTSLQDIILERRELHRKRILEIFREFSYNQLSESTDEYIRMKKRPDAGGRIIRKDQEKMYSVLTKIQEQHLFTPTRLEKRMNYETSLQDSSWTYLSMGE